MPAEEAELDAFLYVALFVAFYLLLPELAIALWRYIVPAAFVTVPKAAVDKYCGLVLAQDDVGGAGQAFDIYAIAVAMGVEVTAHNQLGFGVLALDARHALMPLLFAHSVCHSAKITIKSQKQGFKFRQKNRKTEDYAKRCDRDFSSL